MPAPACGPPLQPADAHAGGAHAAAETFEGEQTDEHVANDVDAAAGPCEESYEPTEGELREAHTKDKQLVDYLARQGLGADHPVRAAAEAQAAESRRAWDAAKPGKAVTLRMRWAEEALTRARRSQARMEQTIDDLDRDYEAKRLQYVSQLADLRARTKEREDKLADVARQAAIEFGSAEVGHGGEPLRQAAAALEAQVTPTIEGLLEHIPSDSPARQRVAEVVAILKGVQGTVAKASTERLADAYDIGDYGDEYDDYDPHGYGDGWQDTDFGSQSQGWDGWYGTTSGGWAGGRWNGAQTRRWGHQSGPGDDDAMDTADVQAPRWYDCEASADGPYARANKRRAVDGEDPNGPQGRHVGASDVEAEDHANAAALQAAVSDAAAAVVAVPAPGTPTAAEHAALEDRRREVWDMAQDQEIAVSQQAIACMGAQELEAWVSANLL